MRSSMQSNRWQLSRNAFLCRSHRHFVVLDLVNDKYLCVGDQVFETLSQASYGISRVEPGDHSSAIGVPDVSKSVQDLVDRGILVTDATIGKDIEPVVAAPPVTSTLADPPADRTALWMLRVPSFLRACRRAARDLSRNPLYRTVQEVKNLRHHQLLDHGIWDPVKSRALIGDFAALRFIFPRSYLCLFDSLALIHFLAAYDQFPTWVFGVDAEPFTAHCWLQEGCILLNDTLANVSRYTPIMAV
jgi:Transglutaminase-like superfamily